MEEIDSNIFLLKIPNTESNYKNIFNTIKNKYNDYYKFTSFI